MERKFAIIIFTIVCGAGNGLIWECPLPKDMPEKCSCEWRGKLKIECEDLLSTKEPISVMKFFSDYKVNHLKIKDSILMFLPKEMFADCPLELFEIYNSEILGLESDNGEEMFRGLEDSLVAFYVKNVTGLRSWRWSAFSALNRLQWLLITNSDINEVGNDFSLISPLSLFHVVLDDNQISYLGKYSFSTHEHLRYWSVNRNKIENIQRSILPNPARQLKDISLRENRISVIPDDFFTNMPALENVFLNDNKIKFLSANTFNVMERGQRFVVDLRDNKIYCCSDIKWFLNSNYKDFLIAICEYPSALRGQFLQELKNIDLEHGNC